MARFVEVLRCCGVDEDAIPTGMVVPLGGANHVALTEGKGLRVVENHRGIDIEEVDPSFMRDTQRILRAVLPSAQNTQDLSGLQAGLALTPDLLTEGTRLFRIHGRHKVDFPGVLVHANSGRAALTTLKVVVVDKVTVKIAIQNLMVPDKSGTMIFHAKSPSGKFGFMTRRLRPAV